MQGAGHFTQHTLTTSLVPFAFVKWFRKVFTESLRTQTVREG